MSVSPRQPRLAVIVGNHITGDSRVQKIALAAAYAGWEVLLLGRSSARKAKSEMGPVRVVRVPIPRREVKRRFRFVQRPDEVTRQIQIRELTARIGSTVGRPGLGPALVRTALRTVLRLGTGAYAAKRTVYQWQERRWRERRPDGDWRIDMPSLLDLDAAFGPVIEKFRPDVIHANDITMIGVAARSAARLRNRGWTCRWLYDAHEYVRGVDWRSALRSSAYHALEKEYIGQADAVVTVSPELAAILEDAYRLEETPLVVRNAPVRSVIGATIERAGLREVCGLASDVPLLVYAGWIDAQRGLDTAVTGLARLPGVHLALVVGKRTPALEQLLELGDELGVGDRIHVVPYVPQAQVPDFLASADLGLICFRKTPNCEVSLPTKLPEYLHAGLPVVTSDVATVTKFVEATGVGEVFTATDPATFATAVAAALDRRADLAARITPDLLDELSWEHQSAGLLGLYRKLSGKKPRIAVGNPTWQVRERDKGTSENPWTALDDSTPIRLGLGPANYAGQLATFAQAISKERRDVSMEVFMAKAATSTFDYPADVTFGPGRYGQVAFQVEQVGRIAGRYTHLLADAFLPVLGHLNGDHIGADLPALRRAQIQVALLAHGSEIRHPGRHMERHPTSLFRAAPEGFVERMTKTAERNARTAAESGLPCFVTTPDLLDDLPQAVWVPLVVDVDAWACPEPVLERARPIVLHAPSKRWTKGTGDIVPILEELHERKVIEFRLAEKVNWSQMREQVWEADIVVDQFAIGAYGTFACEAMSAGKPVIAYLSDGVADALGEHPIVNAVPATLAETVERLLDDRDAGAELGRRSAAFARAVHGGTQTVSALKEFLQ
ncbi:glycosyltransferase [Nonomuraea typhae]|uniref:glycosyltransferase n=1 Tax=Nonomuraea typhae TaxID=2603600 RepID=UPI0012F82C3F|nr:glycosyltransferase [Nonomuraea typhae]